MDLRSSTQKMKPLTFICLRRIWEGQQTIRRTAGVQRRGPGRMPGALPSRTALGKFTSPLEVVLKSLGFKPQCPQYENCPQRGSASPKRYFLHAWQRQGPRMGGEMADGRPLHGHRSSLSGRHLSSAPWGQGPVYTPHTHGPRPAACKWVVSPAKWGCYLDMSVRTSVSISPQGAESYLQP